MDTLELLLLARQAWVVWLMLLFLGIVAWVLWPGRRREMEHGARIPFDETDPDPETRHGPRR
jgi:cytochrome c oxidase cbb3-type subunit 4